MDLAEIRRSNLRRASASCGLPTAEIELRRCFSQCDRFALAYRLHPAGDPLIDRFQPRMELREREFPRDEIGANLSIFALPEFRYMPMSNGMHQSEVRGASNGTRHQRPGGNSRS